MRRLVIALLISAVCRQAYAETDYLVGVEALNYYPHYSNEGDAFSGFARDVLDAFAHSKGYRFEYRALPVARLYRNFFGEKLDFKYPDNPSWQTAARLGKAIRYSAPVASYTDGVLVLPAHLGQGLERLTSLGTVRGFTPWKYLDAIRQGTLIVREVTSLQQSLLQGIAGRVDGVYMNVDVGRYQLAQVLHKPDALVFDETLPYVQGFYRLSSIRHPAVVEEFDTFLHSNAAEVGALKRRYGIR